MPTTNTTDLRSQQTRDTKNRAWLSEHLTALQKAFTASSASGTAEDLPVLLLGEKLAGAMRSISENLQYTPTDIMQHLAVTNEALLTLSADCPVLNTVLGNESMSTLRTASDKYWELHGYSKMGPRESTVSSLQSLISTSIATEQRADLILTETFELLEETNKLAKAMFSSLKDVHLGAIVDDLDLSSHNYGSISNGVGPDSGGYFDPNLFDTSGSPGGRFNVTARSTNAPVASATWGLIYGTGDPVLGQLTSAGNAYGSKVHRSQS